MQTTAQAPRSASSTAGLNGATKSPPDVPMSIQVSGKHMAVGEALRSRIEAELAAGVGRFFERGGSGDVVLSKDGHSICCDVALRLASGQLLQAKGLGGDAHAAFSNALEKISTRVRRYKNRLKDHHPHPGQRPPDETTPYMVLRSAEDDDLDEDWGADHAPPASMVIAETEATVKTLTVSGAVMELDLTDTPMVLFRNAAHGGLAVVYRRGDGNIGWIDPERTKL
jgi:ribosomal subunit interface protein